MKVLVVGSGGREHALAWHLAGQSDVQEVLVAPGNGGTASTDGVRNCPVSAEDIEGLVALAQKEQVDLTIIGPEAPLVAGVVDRFTDAGLACFGPSRAAAQLEGSKIFAKKFMQRHHIPTADWAAFSDAKTAVEWIEQRPEGPLVIKADGLAAGKGVFITADRAHACEAVRSTLRDFGESGKNVVVEEFIQGEEVSFIALADGTHLLPLDSSQDHKARDDGDKGPNTGGMGAYSPAPVVTPELHERILKEVMQPTVRGMAEDGHPFTGFLYAGLMIDPSGTPKVLEFNCRLGDPETQPLLMRLQSSLGAVCLDALRGNLSKWQLQWDKRSALGVVMASDGYPNSYSTGETIQGLGASAADAYVFHAGTQIQDGQVATSGGRVLCATALGADLAEAQKRAYALVRTIHWDGAFCRSDIGHRGIGR